MVTQNSTILGYCDAYTNNVKDTEAYITLIDVKIEYQRKHIGQALHNAVINQSISKSMRAIGLEVDI